MAGVPSAVLKQRERLEAQLGVNADGTPVATTPTVPELTVVPSTPPAVTPEPTPVVSAAPDATQARIKELEHLLSTRDGQTSTAMREANEARQRAEVMASQVQSLEESIAALQRQAETAEARAAARQAGEAIPSLDGVDELTPEELTTYGDSVSVVNKLTKKQLVSYFKPLLAKLEALEKQVSRVSELDKLPALEKVIATTQSETERVREEEFFRKEVLQFFPDFEAVRDTADWKTYLHADIPGRGIKVHHLLDQYRKVHNAQGIRSLIEAHYDTLKAKPTLAALATPRGAQTEGTPVVKPHLKASEYKEKLRQWTHKRLPKDQWESFKSEFTTALNEGRVDMDVAL